MKNIINRAELASTVETHEEFQNYTEQKIALEFIEALSEFEGNVNQDELDEFGRQWADRTTPIYTTDILDFYRENINFIEYIGMAQKEQGAEGFDSLTAGIYLLRREIADRVINLIVN